MAASRHDVREPADLEAGPADERPVDVRLRHDLVDIVRFDAAAVNHMTVIGGRRPEPLAQPATDVRVRLGRL